MEPSYSSTTFDQIKAKLLISVDMVLRRNCSDPDQGEF